MLVYIRESDWDTIFCPCEKEDIAEHIRNRLEVEQLEQVRRQREKETAHLYVVIKVACDRDFQKQIGSSQYFDLVNLNQVKSYRIHKKTVFKEFQQKVAEDFGVQPSWQRFWVWKQRHSGTVRPDSPLPSGGKIDDVLDLRNYKDNLHSPNLEQATLMAIALYLEVPESPTRPMFDIPPDTVLLFFKLYDPHKRHLSYVAHRHVHKAEPFSKIFKTVGELAGFTEGTEIVGCEEVSFEPEVLCEDLPADSTPEKSQLICGDVICVQKRLTDVEAHELELPTVRGFLESICNIVESTSGH
ncbi:unnamed protein product [Ostreobium quekettii]|uniref:Ubiquitin carboxyl-terminal hydrolase 7 ICP0-binding domain-containing protein n=1 Tax=Ostreobium quekettii TaxID=121088 RepID=A0A8S1JIR7_9CHLO|nr:unnamed protein product [Ostreobium quekettii]